jgi:probable F420-dependent oxidoreductase
MRFGLHALGVGPGADPDVVVAVAAAAERRGFSTLWAGEHIVMVDGPDTPYPYADDGRIALPSDVDWLDPLVVLTFAAAATSRLRLATGILLLPEHQPVAVAKRAASLDVLSKGRFVLGIGIGWSAAEFAAVGVPFEGRAARTREYVDAMRALWADDVSSYRGDYVRFERVRSYPKPRRRRVPVVVGGNSDPALARAAAWGDGWYGFNVPVADVPGRLASLHAHCRREDGTRARSTSRSPWPTGRPTTSPRSIGSGSARSCSSSPRRPRPVRSTVGSTAWPTAGKSAARSLGPSTPLAAGDDEDRRADDERDGRADQ